MKRSTLKKLSLVVLAVFVIFLIFSVIRHNERKKLNAELNAAHMKYIQTVGSWFDITIEVKELNEVPHVYVYPGEHTQSSIENFNDLVWGKYYDHYTERDNLWLDKLTDLFPETDGRLTQEGLLGNIAELGHIMERMPEYIIKKIYRFV